MKFNEITTYAIECHNDTNCKYDGKEYSVHLKMVFEYCRKFSHILPYEQDRKILLDASWCHDLIEDTNQTYNDVRKNTSKEIADIVLLVTDIPGENRLIRQLLTFPKIIKNPISIILKMCDIAANVSYGKERKTSMYKKYVDEYFFKKYIFQKALKKFDKLNKELLDEFWDHLDKLHDPVMEV